MSDSDKPGLGSDTPTQAGTSPDVNRRRVSLVLFHRDGAKVVPVHEGHTVVVGRSHPSDVIVPDMSLSRQHARFLLDAEGLVVEDLGSTNGTQVGGRRIERVRLRQGDVLQLGNVSASFHVVAPGKSQLRGFDGHDRFLGHLEDELLRARSFGRQVTVLMVRSVSPTDERLGAWALRIRSELRPVDRVAVYGPSAVLVMLPEQIRDEARETARRLVRPVPDEPRLVVGLASYPEAGSTADELVEVARQMARRAKAEDPVIIASRGLESTTPVEGELVVKSARMIELFAVVDRLAMSTIPVLVLGETGTGKEMIARAIHERGPRRNKPLRAMNCGAIPATLIESVLFGHEKGSFTGAERAQKGLFEQADGGTVLLDEVGELSAAAQAALLRVLETKRVTRVGSSEDIEVDVRVIAATHRDLEAMAEQGQFRLDLVYRLNPFTLAIPPLRDRPEEIVPLAEVFLRQASLESGGHVVGIDPRAGEVLAAYSWPGNVRELRNVMDRAVVICRGDTVGVEDLPERVRGRASVAVRDTVAPAQAFVSSTGTGESSAPDADFRERVKQYEIRLIVDALQRSHGNQTEAARMLRMPLRTLVHKIRAYAIRKSYGPQDD